MTGQDDINNTSLPELGGGGAEQGRANAFGKAYLSALRSAPAPRSMHGTTREMNEQERAYQRVAFQAGQQVAARYARRPFPTCYPDPEAVIADYKWSGSGLKTQVKLPYFSLHFSAMKEGETLSGPLGEALKVRRAYTSLKYAERKKHWVCVLLLVLVGVYAMLLPRLAEIVGAEESLKDVVLWPLLAGVAAAVHVGRSEEHQGLLGVLTAKPALILLGLLSLMAPMFLLEGTGQQALCLLCGGWYLLMAAAIPIENAAWKGWQKRETERRRLAWLRCWEEQEAGIQDYILFHRRWWSCFHGEKECPALEQMEQQVSALREDYRALGGTQ